MLVELPVFASLQGRGAIRKTETDVVEKLQRGMTDHLYCDIYLVPSKLS